MTPDAPTADRRRHADQLGVAPDAPPADARAAFLRQLPEMGFLPPPPLCAAAAAFSARPVPGAAAAVEDPADFDAVRADVAAFVRDFWSIPPAARRDRWRALLARSAADPLLAGRVRRLEAGVDLPDAGEAAGPPRLREVIRMAQALFLLDPLDRAARRREVLDNLPPPAAGWEQAARQLEQQYPALAALEPALVERLSTWSRRIKVAAAAGHRPAPTWGFQTQGGLTVPQVRRPVRSVSAGQRVPGWTVFLMVLVALRVLGACLTGPSSSPPTYTPPRYSAPVYPPPKFVVPSTPVPLLRGTGPARPGDPPGQLNGGDINERLRRLGVLDPPTPRNDRGPP
jgi:hypothetical protein